MPLRRIQISAVALALLVALLAGCNRGPNLVKVTGKITLNGKPLEGAAVLFHPQSGGRPASGQTDATGRFRLTTIREDDGAAPGQHTVTVALTRMSRQIQEGESWDESAVEYIVPARYGTPHTSGLSVHVVRGMAPVDLSLTR